MSHTKQLIETVLRVTVDDESEAVRVAEVLARVGVGLSDEAQVSIDVERFEQVCHHPQPDDEDVQP